MSALLPDIIGEVLRLEAELVRLARERDRHAPDSAEFERLDAEWKGVHRGDRDHPYTVFDYTPTRKRDGPATFLESYEGYL